MSSEPIVDDSGISVRRVGPDAFNAVRHVFNEYFAIIGVLQRDGDAAIHRLLSHAGSGVWLAYVNGVVAGCVALRPLPAFHRAAECKRLYVGQAFRRRGIADKLIEHMERDAALLGYQTIYLDSKDDLHAAVALYERVGYRLCARYNDHPQATLFMSKTLSVSGTASGHR